jgi:predicted lipoprotein with Yx(FWY)xxD motif
MILKRSLVIAVSIFIAMFIAGCSSPAPATPNGGGSYGSGNTNPPATTTPTTGGSGASVVIQTATATVKGQSETVLADTRGMTLYYFAADSATKSACSSSCAQMWPPQLFTGSGGPTSSTTLAGKLSVQTDANGNQVEYNGHPLYTFSGDTAPGQTNGEGLFGAWFVATPNLAVQGGGGSTNNGYGY